MKLTKIIFNLLAFSFISIAQVYSQAADPSVNGATVNPAPLPAPGSSGSNTASVSFNFLNASTTPIPLNTNNVINVSLSGLDVNGTFSTANNIVLAPGSGDYFSFSYDPATKTLTATQKAVIPGLAGETITFKGLLVTAQSDRTNPQNGLNVNVVFLRTFNAELGNDQTTAFTFTGSGGTTPIRLVSFDGVKMVNKVLLKWQTTSELNSKYFDVEFSENGTAWNSIGTVNAAGTSTSEKSYSLPHNSPVNGVNYYRLKQVDVNGNFTYSNIVAISFTIKGVNINAVYPNPFVSQLKLDISSDRTEVARIQLSDNMGRVLQVFNYSIQKGVNKVSLDNLGGLAPGIYNVEVKTAYSTFRYKLKK